MQVIHALENLKIHLHYSSAHHRSVIHGMIKGKMIRALRCSSSPQIYASVVQDLETWFLAHGYSRKLLKDVQATQQYSDRESFLRHSKNRKLSEMTTVLSVKNHPSITWAELHQVVDDPLLPFKPLISKRRPPNVADLVVRAETPSEQQALRYHLRRRETQNRSRTSIQISHSLCKLFLSPFSIHMYGTPGL